MEKIENLRYGEKERNVLDVILKDNAKGIFFNIHGGGIVEGDKSYNADAFAQITKDDWSFACCNYSLYPNAKFPEYIEDCAKAIKYVRDNYLKPGQKLVVAGQSAGAFIAMMLAFDHHYFEDLGMSKDSVDGWVFESGQPTSHFNVINIELGLPQSTQMIDEHAPMFYVNKDLKFSPALITAYSDDMLNRLNQTKDLMKMLEKCDVDAEFYELAGPHCSGTCTPEADGTYRMSTLTREWLDRKF